MHICLFDIDGTLIDTRGAGRDAMLAALAAQFNTPSDFNGVTFAGRTDRAIVSDLFRLHGIEDSELNWSRFRATFLQQLPKCLRQRQGVVLPCVVELLDQLAANPGLVLGLLTGNLRDGARAKLCHYALYDYFTSGDESFGAFGDRHRERDDVAREALAVLQSRYAGGIDGRSVWVIGDTPSDVQCARAIGANAIAIATGTHSMDQLRATRPDLLMADFRDPGPLLARLGM